MTYYNIIYILKFAFVIAAGLLGPLLQSYTLNMSSREIILTFSKPIQPSNVNVTGIVIQGAVGVITNSSLHYRLTSADSIQVENAIVTVVMSRDDYSALQVRPGVATSASNTYLTMDSTTVTDRTSQERMAQPITGAHAISALQFIEDLVQPELDAFSLNLETTTISLTFNEPVQSSTFAPQQIMLASSPNLATAVLYQLTGGYVNHSVPASNVINFDLSESDIIGLKSSNTIATSRDTSYISVLEGLVADTNGNINSNLESPIRVSNFTADNSAPTFDAFDLDLDLGVLTLHCNDVINTSTFNATGITLQSERALEPTNLFTLDPNSYTISSNGYTIIVDLSIIGLNVLKGIRHLCTGIENCYMSVTTFVVRDTYGRLNTPISGRNAISAQRFTQDRTPPMLVSWSLDMNEGRMTLQFSETVDITTFQVTQATLWSSPDELNFFALTNYSELVPADTAVVFEIRLIIDDINAIKANLDLGTGLSNSFLYLSSNAIQDMNFNFIFSNAPLQVETYVSDTTAPSLVLFSANLYTGILSLTFDEVVDISTLDPSSLSISNADYSAVYNLTSASYTSQMDSGTILLVTLSESDLRIIRNTNNLATSINNTYLSTLGTLVYDTSRIALIPVVPTSPLQVSIFVDAPILISFANNSYTAHEGEVLTLTISLNTTAASEITADIVTEDNGALGALSVS